jgi:hypothetical protein
MDDAIPVCSRVFKWQKKVWGFIVQQPVINQSALSHTHKFLQPVVLRSFREKLV